MGRFAMLPVFLAINCQATINRSLRDERRPVPVKGSFVGVSLKGNALAENPSRSTVCGSWYNYGRCAPA